MTQKKVAIDKINLSNLASSSSSSWVNLTTMMMKKQHLSIENIFHSLLLHESGGSRPPPLPTPANLRLIALSAEKLQQSWRDYGTIWHQDNLAPLCKNRQFSAYTLKVPYCPWCQIINVTKLSRDPVWRRLIPNQKGWKIHLWLWAAADCWGGLRVYNWHSAQHAILINL